MYYFEQIKQFGFFPLKRNKLNLVIFIKRNHFDDNCINFFPEISYFFITESVKRIVQNNRKILNIFTWNSLQ